MITPIFILCPGRSFSSVVCTMLGQHPELYGVPELNLFIADSVGEMVNFFENSGQRYRMHGLVRILAQLHDGEQTEASVRAAWEWLDHHRNWNSTMLAHYVAELVQPRGLTDKSPSNTRNHACLERMYTAFPNARILHLIRHPRSTGNSLYKVYSERHSFQQLKSRKRQGRKRQRRFRQLDTTKVELHWLETHKSILDFTNRLGLGQSMRLQGELLLSDPDTYLVQICQWLGISTAPEAIDAMKHPEQSPYACYGPPNARGGNNRGFLEDPKLRVLKRQKISLNDPLEWLNDNGIFQEETIALARQFGY